MNDQKASIRWYLLQAAAMGGHIGATEAMALTVVESIAPSQANQRIIRDELHYLADRQLISIERSESSPWRFSLTRTGRDLTDYTVACEPGIARPPRYWDPTTGGTSGGHPL